MTTKAKEHVSWMAPLLTFLMMLLFFFLNSNKAESNKKVDKEVFDEVKKEHRRDIDRNAKDIKEQEISNGEYFRMIYTKLGELEGKISNN